MSAPTLRHWRLERGDDGIATAILDREGESTHVLSRAVLDELGLVLDDCQREPPRGLILRSGKEAGFIAGADVGEFAGLSDASAARALVAAGWDLFSRLAAVPWPSLALVRGHCLGGGLELALACRYLIVVDETQTRLGLPEVLLGIFPGWGGMARLPARIGPSAALDLMLSGRSVDARRAQALGLADACVPARVMDAAARDWLLSGRPRRPLPFVQRLLAGPLRGLAAAGARRAASRKANPRHYPAPYAIIDLWSRHGGNALAALGVLDTIVASPTARNLLRVFALQERLKACGRDSDFRARRVHVVGAGVMGGDIAAWCVLQGLGVSLQDQGLARIAPAIARARRLFERRLRDPLAVRDACDRLIPDPDGVGVAHADVVIEAIFEDADAKRSLLAGLEGCLKPGAILASNTSSLRLEDLRTALDQPARLVGIHFFNPVARMPLVEVVSAADGEAEAARAAAAFVRQIGKLPLPVKSAPGFLVNAVLAPYLLEALRAVDEGIAPETVDAALLAFGMPVGPVELADTIGLDITLAAGRQLAAAAEPPACLNRAVAEGRLGRKTGRGFYVWSASGAQKSRAGAPPEGLAERLLAPLIAATRQRVAEGIVADDDLADAGVIFATGFAPYTGGPLHYARERSKIR